MPKTKKLRIAHFVTAQRSIPLEKGAIFAPVDLALHVVDEAKRRGHSQTFYAPPSALPVPVKSGKLQGGLYDKVMRSAVAREYRKGASYGIPHICLFDGHLMGRMIKDANAGRFDVIHSHCERILQYLPFTDVPVVLTLHDPIGPYAVRAFGLHDSPKAHFVSISMAQRRPAPNLHYAANIYNGIDMHAFPFSKRRREGFLFMGRIIKEKGVEDAIAVCKSTGAPLTVIGQHYNKVYLAAVRAKMTASMTYKGVMRRKDIHREYGRAKALLFPIKWEEPFGLVMIEAMACGTPVIAYDRGSVREVVKDGVTGFIVKDRAGMRRAMRRIDEIDPAACRKWVEERFSAQRMASDYIALYERLVNARRA